MSLNIRNRIRKAQVNATAGGSLGLVADAIARGAYYDEMTEEEKNAYCDYHGFDRDAMERLEVLITGTLHFQAEKKPKPPTQAEFEASVREVERLMNEYTEQYNSEEEMQRRIAEYERIKQEGEERKKAMTGGTHA